MEELVLYTKVLIRRTQSSLGRSLMRLGTKLMKPIAGRRGVLECQREMTTLHVSALVSQWSVGIENGLYAELSYLYRHLREVSRYIHVGKVVV